MTASKAGYVDITYGAKRPGRPGHADSARRRTEARESQHHAAEGQRRHRRRDRRKRRAVAGHAGARDALRDAHRRADAAAAGQDQTDDRGMYRIYGLQPGEYIVSAVPRNMNLGDLRQTIMAEIEAVMQQAAERPRGGRSRRWRRRWRRRRWRWPRRRGARYQRRDSAQVMGGRGQQTDRSRDATAAATAAEPNRNRRSPTRRCTTRARRRHRARRA